jgi:hypothetical protein
VVRLVGAGQLEYFFHVLYEDEQRIFVRCSIFGCL